MPVLFVLIGLAAVVAIAASGHSKKPSPPLRTAAPSAPAADGAVELDRAMPDVIVGQVLSALAHERSAAHLEALAHGLEAHYPLSASVLRARAATLHPHDLTERRTESHSPAPAPASLAHAEPPAPQVPVASAPEPPMPPPAAASPPEETRLEVPLPPAQPSPAPVAPSHTPAGAHELEAATVLQAAMRALVEELDPVVLEGFAESIRSPYGTAAALLLARAHALRMAAQHPIRGIAPPSRATPPAAPAHAAASAPAAPSPMESPA
jgi:hypothetical protein